MLQGLRETARVSKDTILTEEFRKTSEMQVLSCQRSYSVQIKVFVSVMQ